MLDDPLRAATDRFGSKIAGFREGEKEMHRSARENAGIEFFGGNRPGVRLKQP
jgi:hypothetical protein